MQLEAVPRTRLQSQQSVQKNVLAALQSVNTDVSLLGSKAASLADPATWTLLKGTSSGTAVSVTVRDQAKAGSSSFDVAIQSVAVAHQTSFDFAARTTDTVTSGQLRLDFADSTKSPIILSTDGTLQGLADAINDPARTTGLKATVVRTGADATGAPTYGLVVTASATGAASAFTLTHDDAGGSTAGSALAQQTAVRTGA